MPFIVATFYHFFDFPHFAAHRAPLKAEMNRLGIKGSLLIAPEGINGTLSGTRDAIDAMLSALETLTNAPLERKESLCDRQPFQRAKVRLKKEVISLGAPSTGKTGQYVPVEEWNALIADPDVTLIDARNHYEVHLGRFKGAHDPDTRNFKELPDYVARNLDPARHKKIATYCTGGIRCEKFSGWLLAQGFEQVYQLKGGILKYLEDIPPEASAWEGECYVFDERVAVGHGLTPSAEAGMCRACGHALTASDRDDPHYREGERCSFCAGT